MAEAPFYDDVSLPDEFEPGIVVSLDWNVQIRRRRSGAELRMLRASQPGATIDVAFDAGDNDLIELLLNLDFVVAGPHVGFRCRDPKDFTIPFDGGDPQLIGTGDGTEDTFQLIKTYEVGSRTRDRIIKKPVAGTLELAIDGTPTTAFTLDASTGIVTLDDPLPNGNLLTVTACEFDIPVRFRDKLQIRLGNSPTNVRTETFTLVGLIVP